MLVTTLKKLTIAVIAVSLLGSAAWAQQKPKKSPWKDRAEYDMFSSATKEKDPAKQVQILDGYLKKYPESNFKLQVQLMYALAYQKLSQADKMYAAAQGILKLDPKNVQGLYFITSLTSTMTNPSAQQQADGKKAAQGLVSAISGMSKPASISDAAWTKQKNAMLKLGHQVLGSIAMNQKDNATAEREFRKVLNIDPKNAQVSFWLGTVVLAQPDTSKQAAAFWHFARAANLSGEGAMPAKGKAEVNTYLKKIYTQYHGDESGLDEIVQQALANPFPPAGFKVKSKQQLAAEADEKLRREHPKLYMWLNVKKQLEGPSGVEYFNGSVKNTAMPPMTGYLVAQSPHERPDTLVLGIAERGKREVTLKLNQAYKYPARAGTRISFQCVPRTFSQSPFNLRFECDTAKVNGWPPPPRRKTKR